MKLAILILALCLTGCIKPDPATKFPPPPTPQKIMALSVKECSYFHKGESACIADQYERNMRWYYYKTAYEYEGPVGVPGSSLTPAPSGVPSEHTKFPPPPKQEAR